MSLALVQVTPIYQSGSLQTGSCTFSSAVTPGNFIGLIWGLNNSMGPPYAPSTTVGDGTDTYTQLRNDGANGDFGTQQMVQCWYANNITASSAVTVTINAGSTFGVTWALGFEVSGQNTVSPIDTSGNVAAIGSASSLSVNLTTTASNTMVVASLSTSFFASSWTPGAGYTTLRATSAGSPSGAFYQLLSSAGLQSPSASIGGGPDAMLLPAFAIAGTGPTSHSDVVPMIGGGRNPRNSTYLKMRQAEALRARLRGDEQGAREFLRRQQARKAA